jgi:putative peptide maturation dehydrogenase
MRIRRCAVLMIEPRERIDFDLRQLADGGTGMRSTIEWVARMPHMDVEAPVSADEAALLGEVSPTLWTTSAQLAAAATAAVVERLLESGALVAEGSETHMRDMKLREIHWRPAAAVMHYASRWHGVDTEDSANRFVENFEGEFLDRLGPAPAVVLERADRDQRFPLPPPATTAFDELLGRRVTCRNFARERALPMAHFSAVLYRAFGARALDDYAPGFQVMKKAAPSAGALHPTEAYVLVQHVEGIEVGLYHYHPVDHALEPMHALTPDAAAALARRCVASQAYFVDAHVIVFATSRLRRQSWKYRNHAKAYRALILDIGHLSQTLYLAATELGLGAFITAAINEVDIEQALGLDPLEEAPLAVSGFGFRAATCEEEEFDPLNAVWSTA